MGNVNILVGAQWGDEGKGKWIDILAKKAAAVVRFQGGNNAGHTIYVDGEKIVLHHLPTGFLQGDDIVCVMTCGMVVNPGILIEELENISKRANVHQDRFWLSARAHVISPWHVYQDCSAEDKRSTPIGTTRRGIGPTYSDKVARRGLRVGYYIDEAKRNAWIDSMSEEYAEFSRHVEANPKEWDRFHAVAAQIAPFVCDAEARLRELMRDSKKQVLVEGAQGSLLDLDHGTYPFVTSSTTVAGGAFASVGIAPTRVDKVIGITKAYMTRVGEGPFPTELKDEIGSFLCDRGKEYGSTTGRPRRCGWLDLLALRYSIEVNGINDLILNKFDILSGLDEVCLAVAYEHPEQGRITEFPWDYEVLERCKPVLKTFSGWSFDPEQTSSADALPDNAMSYIRFIEEAVSCKISLIGTGVGRNDSIELR